MAGTTEPALPIAGGQHYPQRLAWRIVFDTEDPAENRLHSQQRQCRGSYQQRLDTLRIAASGDRDRGGIPGADRLERLLVLAIGQVSGGAMIRACPVRRVLPHAHQPLGLMEGEGPQQHAVHDAEDRGGGTDAQRQRQDLSRPQRLVASRSCGWRSAGPARGRVARLPRSRRKLFVAEQASAVLMPVIQISCRQSARAKGCNQQERVRSCDWRNGQRLHMTDEVKNYITPGGYRKLQEELARLWKEERPAVVTTVAWAAANGDRSENGDYIYGKKKLREIDRRIRYLSKSLDRAVVVDNSARTHERVHFGATVTVLHESGNEREVTIVGVDELDAGDARVSWRSPLARALLTATVGDTVTLRAPRGPERLEIVAVRYDDLR